MAETSAMDQNARVQCRRRRTFVVHVFAIVVPFRALSSSEWQPGSGSAAPINGLVGLLCLRRGYPPKAFCFRAVHVSVCDHILSFVHTMSLNRLWEFY